MTNEGKPENGIRTVQSSGDVSLPEISIETWVHPLDTPEVRTYLTGVLPNNLKEALLASPRPHLSGNVTLAEENEAGIQIRRRNQTPNESVPVWTLRTLYEESFAVMPAITLGGLITHYRSFGYETTREALLSIDPKIFKLELEDLLERLNQVKVEGATDIDFTQLGRSLLLSGVSVNSRLTNYEPGAEQVVSQGIQAVENFPRALDLLKIGWPYYQTRYFFEQELEAPLQDPNLTEQFNLDAGKSRGAALKELWKIISKSTDSPTSYGVYKTELDEGFVEGLQQAAILRASPDLAFLFEYFSATGSIHSRVVQ